MKDFKISPYSLRDYSRDAKEVIQNHLDWLRTNPIRPNANLGAMLSTLRTKGKTVPLDPYYAAQWSALARKRKAGLLLLFLYYVAKKHQLDMTTIFAQRLLIGWVDCSISNKVLITAFGDPNRDASNKSIDWPRLDELIIRYRDQVQDKLKHDRAKQKKIKEIHWHSLNIG